MSPRVLPERLVLVFTWCILPLVYAVELVGLLEDPTFSVGMISRFTRGTMNLTYLVQNFIDAGQFVPGAFRAQLLAWLRAFESGIYCRALRAIFFILAFLLLLHRDFPFPSLTSDVLGSLVLHLASQLSSPAQKRVMSAVRADIDFGFSWPRCLSSHSSRMLCLKAAKASASGQSTIWFFLVRNLFQSFRADSPGC